MSEPAEILKGWFDGIAPEPIRTVSEWSDQFRMLSQEASAEPGRWRTSRTPYLREIMDHLSSASPTKEIVFKKAAQIGATECGYNALGYWIDDAPGPILMVMPTEATVKRNSKMRINPMIKSTPRLSEKVVAEKSRDSGNTILQKDFPGGTLIMSGANSAAGLRSMPIRYLMLDEVDGYPSDLDGEGSPVDLAKARTNTFSKRKIFMLSTPTVDGASIITDQFETTDQRRFHVPCPHCGAIQWLKWDQLRWDKGKPETVKYQCEHCEMLIDEREKEVFLARGEWVAMEPANASVARVGYHLNSLYSPLGWFSWEDAVRQFEAIRNDANKDKTFHNTVLGEPYKESGERPNWEILFGRREDYGRNTIRRDCAVITAGVDVQRDRLEMEIVGWGKNKNSYSIDYRVIFGDSNTAGPWEELEKVFTEKWKSPEGIELGLHMMAVDSGYNSEHAYKFCRKHGFSKVFPIKGQEKMSTILSSPSTVDIASDGVKIGTTKLWNIGVSVLKSELYGYLLQNAQKDGEYPAGYCHFPHYDDEYFKGLTAEQNVFRIDKRGYRKYQWEKKYKRNEPLDCRNYARAAAELIGWGRWDDKKIEAVIIKNEENSQLKSKPIVKKKKSDFWGDR